MPKMFDLPPDSALSSESVLWGNVGNRLARFPAGLFRGPAGDKGTDGVNGTDGADAYVITDASAASPDFLLPVGDIAYIDFAAATSVPLHIATVPGVYRVTIIGDVTASAGDTGANAALLPNNNTTGIGEVAFDDGTTYDRFLLPAGRIMNFDAVISTILNSKTINYTSSYRTTGSTLLNYNHSCWWKDATVDWTSLGTFTFNFAQTGRVIVFRMI